MVLEKSDAFLPRSVQNVYLARQYVLEGSQEPSAVGNAGRALLPYYLTPLNVYYKYLSKKI